MAPPVLPANAQQHPNALTSINQLGLSLWCIKALMNSEQLMIHVLL
jgi:hypothetical protein